MKTSPLALVVVPTLFLWVALGLSLTSCGGSPDRTGTGGRAATGGSSASGGGTATGGSTATGGREGTGGGMGRGGTTGAGNTAGAPATGAGGSGGSGRGGGTGSGGTPATGGSPGSGGRGGTPASGGGTGTGGNPAMTGTGGAVQANKIFSPCRFHFGALDGAAKSNSGILAQIDYFTPSWMGQKDTFDMTSVCDETKSGGALAGKLPVIVAYVAAFYAKRHFGRCDCNVGSCGANNDLCHYGAADISSNLTSIVNVYKSYAQGFASCFGTTKPIVFEMEPDFYQYAGSNQQTAPWTFQQAGQIMSQFVNAMKPYLPNAAFSMDISPWVATNDNTGGDGADNGKNWYSYFDMSLFTFINTSGGGTQAASANIRGDKMTWAGVSQATGKPILADTGYGVGGSSSGPDPLWDSATNINARIDDGVVGIIQYNPSSSWGSTISSVRSQLNTPRACP
ncbi:MAG TPA: hypothetical protein VHH90_04755 [Polyangia bacterium]|nr:hypothetical protein [Polyangia bacterium]